VSVPCGPREERRVCSTDGRAAQARGRQGDVAAPASCAVVKSCPVLQRAGVLPSAAVLCSRLQLVASCLPLRMPSRSVLREMPPERQNDDHKLWSVFPSPAA
jgi:hypothetical protein